MAIESELTAPMPSAGLVAPETRREPRREHRQRGKAITQQLITLYRPRLGGLVVLIAYLAVAFLVYAGWQQRLEWPLSAESGAGYIMGIVGGLLMLLLLLYPMRKHLRFMRRFGPVKFWFRTHMLFGVLGPVLILFHCGFGLGSLNSNVALICMLTVASSGLIGRYFYTRIHHGLYGRKATLEELQQHSRLLGVTLSERLTNMPRLLERIDAFQSVANKASPGFLSSLWIFLTLGIRTWWLYLRFRFALRHIESASKRRRVLRHIGAHLSGIRKLAEFHVYERLFSAWHILHFPLFLMLVISGVVHVIAVHMY